MKRRYESLQEFFLCYFHPDWQLDAASWSEVVKDFVDTADPDLIAAVVTDLRDITAEPGPDDELAATVVREYSLSYEPSRDSLSMRDWLRAVLAELEDCSVKH
jgi:hypothetical protein